MASAPALMQEKSCAFYRCSGPILKGQRRARALTAGLAKIRRRTKRIRSSNALR